MGQVNLLKEYRLVTSTKKYKVHVWVGFLEEAGEEYIGVVLFCYGSENGNNCLYISKYNRDHLFDSKLRFYLSSRFRTCTVL